MEKTETQAVVITTLSPMEALKPDIVAAHKEDPIVAQALSIGDDITLAKRLSELVYVEAPVDIRQIAAHLAQRGKLSVLHTIEPKSQAGDAAAYLLLALQGAFGPQLDLASNRWVFDALVDAGVLSAEERDSLMSMRLQRKQVGVLEAAEAVRDGEGRAKV